MKNIILLLTIFITVSTFSQGDKLEHLPNFDKKTWNFGYYLGVNANSYVIDYKPSNFADARVKIDAKPGFVIGVVAERRLHKNLSLRFEPGLVSNVKTLYFNNKVLTTKRDSVREVPGTYLHLPLLFKFSTDRYKNIRPYAVAGIALDYNFSANEDNPDDNASGEFRTKKMNYMYEVGLGMDFYLPYFKFSPSIRGIFAINDELVRDNAGAASPWTAPIDRMSTRGIFLKLTFE